MTERWLPVVGHEDYEVSDHGRVRSKHTRPGRHAKGGILKPIKLNSGRLFVNLSNGKRGGYPHRVHRLVLEAFIGPCPPGMETLHADDDPTNNHLTNLRWGTRSENEHESVRNGHHGQAKKTHCPAGHEYTPENTRVNTTVEGHRERKCKECEWVRYRSKVRT